MADVTLKSKIIIRNDTAANWSSANPVLTKGEIGIENDTGKFKIGNGVANWASLTYTYDTLASILSQVDQKIEAAVGDLHQTTVYETECAYGADKVAALQAVVESPAQGDIGIVKENISGNQKQYTAYVYNGTAWAAMDGNYDAANVYFAKDLVFTQAFGKYVPDSSGSVEIPTATDEMTLQALFENAFSEEKNPTITQPSTSVSLTGAGAKEVGTEFTPNYSVGFNAGSYQYGPATGVTATAYAVTDSNSGSADTQTGSFTQFTVGDSTNYKVSVTTTHTAGAVPKTNLGGDYTAGQIQAGTKTAQSSAVTGFRSVFAGAVVTPISIDSASIRGLSGKTGQFAKTFSLTIPEGCKQVVIALPNSHTLTKVADVGAFGTDIVSVFQLQTAQVEGLNGYTAAEYNVYVYTPASALGANTYNITCA